MIRATMTDNTIQWEADLHTHNVLDHLRRESCKIRRQLQVPLPCKSYAKTVKTFTTALAVRPYVVGTCENTVMYMLTLFGTFRVDRISLLVGAPKTRETSQ